MWDKIDRLASLFEKAAKAQSIYLYHGTAENVLPSIFSQGLIPDPKERAWAEDSDASIYMPSRQSLQSIYLTGNLLTALGAGNRRGSLARILVIVSVQPQSLVADEDALLRLRNPLPSHFSDFLIGAAYIQAISNPDERTREIKKDYIENNINHIITSLKSKPHPNVIKRVRQLLSDGFIIAAARQAAYVSDWDRVAAYDFGFGKVPQPIRAQAEQDFKQYQDQMTRTLHILARPGEVSDLFNFTARSNEPIRFKGSNRIVAIFKEIPKPDSIHKMLQLVYPTSVSQIPGEAINKLRSDWNKSISEDFRIKE